MKEVGTMMLQRWSVALVTLTLVIAPACSSSSSSGSSSGGSTPPSAAGTSSTAGAGQNVSVTLDQWAVTPSTKDLAAGPVTFSVSNAGTIPHEFVVLRTKTPSDDIKIESFEGEPDRINEDTAGTNVGETGDMAAGASKSLTLDLKPGHYVFLCNLPAHYQQGMHVDVTVK